MTLVRVRLRQGVYILMEQEMAIRLGYMQDSKPVKDKMVRGPAEGRLDRGERLEHGMHERTRKARKK